MKVICDRCKKHVNEVGRLMTTSKRNISKFWYCKKCRIELGILKQPCRLPSVSERLKNEFGIDIKNGGEKND